MSKRNEVTNITANSSYADIITFEKARFKSLDKETAENIKKHFKGFDIDGNGTLDVHEVTKMWEKLGEPKTATQIKKLIAELDTDNDGRVSFAEFLALWCGPQSNLRKDGEVTTSMELKGRIAKSALSGAATFFEGSAEKTKDTTDENRQRIKKEYEEKKKIDDMRKAEAARVKAEEEAKEAAAKASKEKMAARAAMFNKAG